MKKLLIFIILLGFPYITNACSWDGSIDFKIYWIILVILLLIDSFLFFIIVWFYKLKKKNKTIIYIISILLTLIFSILVYQWIISRLLCW